MSIRPFPQPTPSPTGASGLCPQVANLAQMRRMVLEQERRLGFDAIPQLQKDVFYAACLVAEEQKVFTLEDLSLHPILGEVVPTRLYQALSSLVARRMLAVVKSDSRRRGFRLA